MIKWKKSSEIDGKSIGKSWMTYGVLGTVIVTMAFMGVCTPDQGGLVMPSGTAASVDGEKISSLEFRRAYSNTANQLQQQYRDKYDAVALGVSKQVMDNLVTETTLFLEAEKNGITASDAEVDRVIIDGKYFADESGKFDRSRFENFLKNQGHSEASFTEDLRRNIITTKFRNLITTSYRGSEKVAELNYRLDESKVDVEYLRLDPASFPITVAPAEIDAYLAGEGAKAVKDYFDSNKAEFNKEARVKARHILISHKGARNASGAAANRSEAEAKALADTVLAETKKPAADFAALATKYTDEASGKAKGGDLGFFKKEQMVKEFADAAFSMKAGEVSNPVKSPFGYHIIRVDTVEEPRNITFDDAKRSIAEKLITKERRPQLIAERTKTLMADLKAGKNESATAMGLSWKSTGPFAVGARFIPGLGADKLALSAVAQLKTPGQLAAEPIEIGGATYIIRLKSKAEADMSQLTAERRKELSEQSKYMESYTLFTAISEEIKKRYEKDKEIYRNPEFLAYDQRVSGNAGTPEAAQ